MNCHQISWYGLKSSPPPHKQTAPLPVINDSSLTWWHLMTCHDMSWCDQSDSVRHCIDIPEWNVKHGKWKWENQSGHPFDPHCNFHPFPSRFHFQCNSWTLSNCVFTRNIILIATWNFLLPRGTMFHVTRHLGHIISTFHAFGDHLFSWSFVKIKEKIDDNTFHKCCCHK